jgi:hypothetical protein
MEKKKRIEKKKKRIEEAIIYSFTIVCHTKIEALLFVL